MVKDMVHFVQAESVEPSRPEEKILEYYLNRDPETGNHTKIQILEAGYKGLPSPHGHPYWEEIFVLEGTAYCHTAKRWIHPGEYACRPPGMVHGPFVCKDDQGVKALLINTYKFGNAEEEKKAVEFGENVLIRTL